MSLRPITATIVQRKIMQPSCANVDVLVEWGEACLELALARELVKLVERLVVKVDGRHRVLRLVHPPLPHSPSAASLHRGLTAKLRYVDSSTTWHRLQAVLGM